MWNFKKSSLLLLVGGIFVSFSLLFAQQSELFAQQSEKGLFVFSPNGQQLVKVTETNGRSRVSLIETAGMTEISHWELKDFTPHSVEFSKDSPNKLLLASKENILIYQLGEAGEKVIYQRERGDGPAIQDVRFATDGKEIYFNNGREIKSVELRSKKQSNIFTADTAKSVQSMVPLKDQRLVVGQGESKDLQLIHTKSKGKPEILKGHKSNLIGATSPDGQNLYSLDEDDNLARWDLLKKEVALEQKLSEQGLKPLAVSLDESGENLLVLYWDGEKEVGRKYDLRSIENLSPKARPVPLRNIEGKRLYIGFEGIYDDGGKLDEYLQSKTDQKQRPKQIDYYELAQVEADNLNWEASLRYIKLVPLHSENYSKSRQLQRKVYDHIDAKNSLKAVADQLRQGSSESAKILLKTMMAKHPGDPEAQRYLKMVESKERRKLLLGIFWFLFILISLGGAAYLFWTKQKQNARKTAWKSPKVKAQLDERKQFVLLFNQVTQQLQKNIEADRRKEYTTTWQATKNHLELVERKSRQNKPNYKSLLAELQSISGDLSRLFQEMKKGPRPSGSTKQRSQKPGPQEQKKQQQQQQKKKQEQAQQKSQQQGQAKPQAPDDSAPVDFYELLGLRPGASDAQIKTAYKQKLKEYHPDKHHNSSFDWVKEEATRMTRKIGEAYETLTDPRQRANYDAKRKASGQK